MPRPTAVRIGAIGSTRVMRFRNARSESQTGFSGTFRIVGVTRDANDAPLGGCTVQLMRTRDNLVVDTDISDGSGNFALSTMSLPEELFQVMAYLSGSPDVAGMSVNTLLGSAQ